mgnify:CR=1 FL=1
MGRVEGEGGGEKQNGDGRSRMGMGEEEWGRKE